MQKTAVTVRMDEHDFEQLFTNSMQWAGTDWEAHEHRFVPLNPEAEGPSYTWAFAYWFDSWPSTLMARAFLEGIEQPYQLLSDESDGDYTILTDFKSPCWQIETVQAAMEAREELGDVPVGRPGTGGLLADIPAEFVEQLMMGHFMEVPIDDGVRLEVSLKEVRVIHGEDSNELLDEDIVRQLTHTLVTRDLMHRSGQHEPTGCDDHDGHDHEGHDHG